VLPSGANKNVTYLLSNTNVATVNSSGVVTAVKVGTATITVTSVADNNVKSDCEITVKLPFENLVNEYQNHYTDFKVDGAGNIISINLPYFISWDYGTGMIYGGKNSYKDIQNTIKNNTNFFQNSAWKKTQSQIQSDINAFGYNDMKNYGIDCSGFTYFVLNEATKPNNNSLMTDGALYKKFGATYAWGVSAADLTSKANGIQKTTAQDIVVGCTIRFGSTGGHVGFVYKVDKNSSGVVTRIHYAHSNGAVAPAPHGMGFDGTNGPHIAYIVIGNQNEDLDHSSQTWHDRTYTNATAKNLYEWTILLECLIPYI